MNADIDRLARDFEFAAGKLADRTHKILVEVGKEVVDEARELAPSGPTAPHYPGTITMDVTLGDGAALVCEIGPDRERNGQAKLGNIFEYGTSELPPHPHLQPPFDRHLPELEHKLAETGSRLL